MILGQLDLEERVDQLVLVREAPVGGPHADAGAVGDVVERHVQAALGEQLARGVEEPLAIALGVAAQRARSERVLMLTVYGNGDSFSSYVLHCRISGEPYSTWSTVSTSQGLFMSPTENPHHARRWLILACSASPS